MENYPTQSLSKLKSDIFFIGALKKKTIFHFTTQTNKQMKQDFFYSKVKYIKGYIYVSNLKMGYKHVNMSAVYCLQCYFYFCKRCADVELLVHLCLV